MTEHDSSGQINGLCVSSAITALKCSDVHVCIYM